MLILRSRHYVKDFEYFDVKSRDIINFLLVWSFLVLFKEEFSRRHNYSRSPRAGRPSSRGWCG